MKKRITYDNYERCVLDGRQKFVEMKSFRTDKHIINTISQHKLALSTFDDQRHIRPDGISTIPHGHYSTRVDYGVDFDDMDFDEDIF